MATTTADRYPVRTLRERFFGISLTAESTASLTLRGVVEARDAVQLDRSLGELCNTHRPSVVVDLQQVDELHPAALNSLNVNKIVARTNYGSLKVLRPAVGPVRAVLRSSGL